MGVTKVRVRACARISTLHPPSVDIYYKASAQFIHAERSSFKISRISYYDIPPLFRAPKVERRKKRPESSQEEDPRLVEGKGPG